jgi:hypothetical protein
MRCILRMSDVYGIRPCLALHTLPTYLGRYESNSVLSRDNISRALLEILESS